jgi:hypothetical protein
MYSSFAFGVFWLDHTSMMIGYYRASSTNQDVEDKLTTFLLPSFTSNITTNNGCIVLYFLEVDCWLIVLILITITVILCAIEAVMTGVPSVIKW